MAIRPVDLQVAYLAAPQNAAVVASLAAAPQAAQQAAAMAFAQQATEREESIAQSASSEHDGAVKPRTDGGSQGAYDSPEERQSRGEGSDEMMSTDGEQHFIDTMA